jgi:hypothetical protein
LRFNITFFAPPAYAGVRAFTEIGLTLYHALQRLGHEAIVSRNSFYADRINILFGGHLLGLRHFAQLPAQTIIYNTEQLASDCGEVRTHYRDQLAARTVWDYSRGNLDWLAREIPSARAVYAPIGYVPELRKIPARHTEDIDLLFYGHINERRASILNTLATAGIGVRLVSKCYGAERDALIARSKLVLNLHAYDSQIFEIVRVSYLLANACPVVSELDADTVIDPDLRDAVAGAPAMRLVDVIRPLLADATARRALAERGQRIFAARDAVAMLRDTLAATRFD